MSNAERAKRYRERIKADPEKAQAWRNKAASRMRKKRSVAQQKPMGGKHAAPSSVYHGIPPEALIKQYREHWAQTDVAPRITPEQRAALLAAFDDPVPLADYPYLKDLQERVPCTLVKELPQKEKPQ
jgi:hypothetical protein